MTFDYMLAFGCILSSLPLIGIVVYVLWENRSR